MGSDGQSQILGYIAKVTNVIYRLLILIGLFWIGYSLQSIAISLNSPIDPCSADQSGGDADQPDDSPRIIKPFMHKGIL